MSINSFNSLPTPLPTGPNDALSGAKAATATTNTSAAPNGQEFSVYFERMMHPAFSAAATTTTGGSFTEAVSASALKSKEATTSAFSSSLLDPHSSTLAFSHDYLKTKASVTDLKLNVPQSSPSRRHERTANNSASTEPTQDAKNRSIDTSHSSRPAHSTLEHLQKRSDQAQSPTSPSQNTQSTDTKDSDSGATSSESAGQEDPASVVKPESATQASFQDTPAPSTGAEVSKDQKLALAALNLSSQRLPALADPTAIVTPEESAANAAGLEQANGDLKTVALSDQTQIITTNTSPNEKSLADFARAMGFDEAQVVALFGPHAAQTMISNPNPIPNPIPNPNLNANTSLSLSASSKGAAGAASTLTPATGNPSMLSVLTQTDPSLGTASNPLSKLPTTTINSTMGFAGLNTQASAIDASLQSAVSALSTQSALAGSMSAVNSSSSATGSAALNSAENLAQLLTGEGVDPQSVQLNISGGLKNAIPTLSSSAGASLSPTSTLAVLNMTGSQLTEHAIAALQKEFKQLKGLEKADPSLSAFGVASPSDASISSSAQLNMGDTGAQSGNSGSGTSPGEDSAQGAQSTNTGSPINMAETYEKLSDQLTAELSKRMHEQISQGQWKMKFALKPSTLGAVDVQLEMKDGKLAAVFQADNALTQNLLQHSSQQLKDNLKDLGLHQTYVQVDQQNGGQAQQNDQQNNAKNPFEQLDGTQMSDSAQDSTPVVDASMKVKNSDSLLDLMA